MTTWAILTGEYPPQAGGVADYTRLVARGLADAGDRVTVFAPSTDRPDASDTGVSVVRLPDHFARRGRAVVLEHLRRLNPDRILVQYVPHAYGRKAMNVPFAGWVRFALRRVAPVWVMFHEVAFPFVRRPLRHNLIAVANRLMARLVADSADRVFVAIPAWGTLLRTLAPWSRPAEWLPVPSNLLTSADPAAVRRTLPVGTLIGHFGTYGGAVAELLEAALLTLLKSDSDRVALLVGRNAERFRTHLLARTPDLASRVVATGELPPNLAAAHLAACDLLVQPYPDGVSCRRTSVMSGLALGRPVVTNLGPLSEPVWATEENGVTLAASASPDTIVAAAERVLAVPPVERAAMGQSARRWYAARFAVERTVEVLRGGAS
jgi:glycosyltransferase involved in cell wall biosynthesis